MRRKTRKRVYGVAAFIVSACLLHSNAYSEFIRVYTLEPEQIKAKNGRVIKW